MNSGVSHPLAQSVPARHAENLDDRYLLADGTVYLTGIQALVRMIRDRALVDARRGLRSASFVAGYEGSPLAGYDIELARRLTLFGDVEIVHRPAVNEELAATSVAGTQLARQAGSLRPDGVTGYWYGKSPGLDRASDAIRHANLIGTDPAGGAVALIGDDPAGKSSTYPCSSEAAVSDLYLPTLYPADSQDILDFGIHAAHLSRFTGTWSALKITTAVADGASTAVVNPDRINPTIAGLEPSTHRPSAMLIGANLAALEQSLLTRRFPRALDYAQANGLNVITETTADDRIGVIAAGKTYLDVREALERLGLGDSQSLARHGIRLIKLGMVNPVDPQIVRRFAQGLEEIIVVEEKRSFIETAVREILYARADAPVIVGKSDHAGRALFSPSGELDVDRVIGGLARRLGEGHHIEPAQRWIERPRPPARIELPVIARTPYFCSGCPHNSSTRTAEDTLVGAGIGCHGLVMVMDEEQAGHVLGVTQMGGEGAQWIGMAPFIDRDHLVQNIGDGTFTHSGSLAVRAAVAAGINITYRLLYNSAVAMTGGQDPIGGMPLSRVIDSLWAEGVSDIVVTTDDVRRTRRQARLGRDVIVKHRDELEKEQARLAAVNGVTVLIHDQECAAEKRRKRKRGLMPTPAERVVINQRICEGCGDCGVQSNCLSVRPVQTEFGRKTEIHQSSCNLDFSCLHGDCPSFVTVIPDEHAKRAPARGVEDIDADLIPLPLTATPTEAQIRIVGIGGTGIVTIAQLLATAAALEGKHVRSLDQTGLAQKGGAVISDLKVSLQPVLRPGKLSAQSCDLYLVSDPLAGTDAANLKVLSRQRTVAVVSSAQIPTGQMVIDTSLKLPDFADMHAAIMQETSRCVSLNAGELAREALGDEQFSNVVMLGVAFQTGRLPLSSEAIERAIEINGVDVHRNHQAFRLGRRQVAHGADSDPSPQTSSGGEHSTSEVDLQRLIDRRVADLIEYQAFGYAEFYRKQIERVREAERRVKPDSTALAEAAARYLYKLMAYKDEYEVARLALDPEFKSSVQQQFGATSKAYIHLHPPVIRALGMRNKLRLGNRFTPAFRLLKAMRRLRGTPLDIFGYTGVRRLERELIGEYTTILHRLTAELTTGNHSTAVAIAKLPDGIRGYEQIKLDNVDRYRSQVATLLEEFDTL
ncbi:2-oxoacid ferredoxin oxidoreductase [Mycolicibacterium peregrinum]|uniref:indolepyruvate ferredoxin oxidoreductase family protein n=1 Tax=Mycolicibacterium peregrinum TaxID=43304 RepID=UPI0006D85D67|nr:indolepyruvate ferredoxin oxidoreductase family protein [Mycolicibacterium peregrinum]MCV7200413.1 indolepyruvate ferredoxin oxidoreductase family protein [Mycolicibacterium peregrinum]ORW55890.1 2-oxoacid ferredoxin oxidoreductase [Mycolicibacterium peregrinum]OWL99926.1 2-oxoacid ferredoxin oxidoreductase [Mycolicibacterium peregrinum]